ncbi:MAG TPA: glycosyltransferase family 2 protein [Blastococcus sp.]|jgi:glycosyltransferase involved in cell wall biosynthesis|nr:glycosyltransferase family 2 protein [Blastococcus sp.]
MNRTSPVALAPLSRRAETAVVMPVYNEATVVAGVIKELVDLGMVVIAVDDGSSDHSADEIDKAGALRVTHPINLGQGGALQTGFDAAQRFTDAKYIATFDADGQHQAKDLLGMIEKIKQGYDVVLGSRFLDGKTEMSWLRRSILKVATKVFNRGSEVRLTDAHNGLRLVTREVAAKIDLAHIGMAHASELEQVLTSSHLRVTEYPVHVLYTEYSRSKGQPLLNSINILADIVSHRITTWSRK